MSQNPAAGKAMFLSIVVSTTSLRTVGTTVCCFQKGSRRADFRYLVATLVDKLQGRARLWVKKEELSNYEHDKWYGNSSWFTSRRKLEFGHISKRVPR